jgi:hypothetical protein
MTGRLEQQLDGVAKREGWKLVWNTEQMPALSCLSITTLRIYRGRHDVTKHGPVWVVHSAHAAPRETIADAVLNISERHAGMREAV